ncbi:MAG: hypothetical protein KDD74_02625 [Anaerolineales bacterium]|nr:hypothetical protein [Anaerolineales bacterium]
MEKNLLLFLIVAALLSLMFYPMLTPTLGTITLLLSLALSTYAIYTKHAGTENAHAKILKEVGIMVLTLIAVIFLGGVASMLANVQVGMRWGEVAGIVSAIGASFGVGYLVRVGMGRLLEDSL